MEEVTKLRLEQYPIPHPVAVRGGQASANEIADWLMTASGERWSHAYHHGGEIWHRAMRAERFASILETHSSSCSCETSEHNVMWGGGAATQMPERYLLSGTYGIYEPSEYLSNLSSPA
jgi:hypothetical protein